VASNQWGKQVDFYRLACSFVFVYNIFFKTKSTFNMNKHTKNLWAQAQRWAYIQDYDTPEQLEQIRLNRFAELIVKSCTMRCEDVGKSAAQTAKSDFVTPIGQLVHEGMYGGALNCITEIKHKFGDKND
jgi:hypothetical protein